MNLNRVTISGADDSIDPEELVALTAEFPFVEWGILLSKSGSSPRYPSLDWMERLSRIDFRGGNLPLSGHLCGEWMRDLCQGDFSFLYDCPSIIHMFKRIQLNFRRMLDLVDENKFLDALKTQNYQYIFQLDNFDNPLLDHAKRWGIVAYPMFDRSGGEGVLAENYPTAIQGYCGYAGGLSPENLQEQLEKISQVVGNNSIWIDAETNVRSCSDMVFDLERVEAFLAIAKKWITTDANVKKQT